MRLAFATDFHGNMDNFSTFLDLARQQQADAAIVGGDVFPVSRPHAEMLRSQWQFPRAVLRSVLRDHRAAGGCPVYILPGNNDWRGAFEELAKARQDGLVTILGAEVHPLADGYVLVAVPYVPPTPWRQKDFDRRDLSTDSPPEEPTVVFYSEDSDMKEVGIKELLAQRPSIEEEMERLDLAAIDPAKTIYVMHSPPFHTGLDVSDAGVEIGSKALRASIEKYQPVLSLHGHVHEAPVASFTFARRLGRTIVVNPGASVNRLQAVTVDLNGEVRLQHTVFGSTEGDNLREVPD